MYKVLNAGASRVCVFSAVRVRRIWVAVVGLVFLFAGGSVQAQQTINVPAAQPTIQSGINAANNGDTVLVAPGTYIENINFNGKAITVTSSGGASATIIDGGAKGSVVTFQTSETASAVLNGFTIRNGLDIYGGGGIYIWSASPTITGNIITQNHATAGCGIYIYWGSPLIQNNTITANDQNNAGSGGTGGGGIAVEAGAPRIIGNTILNNTLNSGFGGGISLGGSNALVENNLIQGNSTSNDGGGVAIYNSGLPLVIQNVIVSNRSLSGSGGGLYVGPPYGSPGPTYVINNTVVANSAYDSSSGIYVSGWGQYVTFTNNIIAAQAGQNAVTCSSIYSSVSPVFSYNDAFALSGAWSGICDSTTNPGNISTDPLFLSSANNDFHLQAASPAVNAGTNAVANVPSTDFDGNPRMNGTIDMGAYEVVSNSAAMLSPTSLSFGSQSAGTSSSPQTVTLNSTGIATFQVTSVQITGPFTFTTNCPTIGSAGGFAGIASGNSCSYSVTFAPPDGSQSTGSLIVNGTNGISLVVALHGAVSPVPAVILSAADIAFPAQAFGSTWTPQSITVTNSGTATLNISQIVGASPPWFTETDNCSAPVPVGASCMIAINFVPATPGTVIGTLLIYDDAPYSPQTVSLYGTEYAIVTSLSLTASPNPSIYGQGVLLTATLQAPTVNGFGSPTGSVIVYDTTTHASTSFSLPVYNKQAQAVVTSFSGGTHSLMAQYSGDAYFQGSASSNVTMTVGPAQTATTVTSSVNPASGGQSVTLTAAVQPSTATGTITFLDGTSTLGSATLYGGRGQLIQTLAAGTHSITAKYSGDTNYAASTSSALAQTVNVTSTTTAIASSLNPSVFQQAITLTATVQPNFSVPATGTITFVDGANILGSSSLYNGSAALFIYIAGGTHSITARYSGDANYAASTSPILVQIVNPASSTTTLTSSLNPVASGQAVTFTVAIQSPGSMIGGGSVTFLDGTTTLGSANISNGSAQFTVTLGAGSHSITASYPGIAGAIAGSVSPAIVEVVNAPPVAPGGFFVRGGTKRMTTAAVSMQPSYNAQPQQGDLLVAYVWWNSSTATISSVTDNCNNTWVATPAQLDSVDGAQAQLFYVAGSKLCNASATLTVSFSSAVIGRAVLGDWSGMGAGAVYFDAGATNFSTSTTTPSSNVSTNNMQDLIIQVAAGDNSNGVFTSAGGFKNRVSSIGMVMADSTVATAQNYSASLTDTVSDNILSGVFGFELTTAPAFPVQSSLNAAAATSISCSYPQNVRAGDVLAAYVWWPQNSAVTMSVADNINGAWLPAGGQATETGSPHSSQLFYLANTAAGAVTITATPSNGASQQLYMECTELSGMATSNVLDGTPATAFSTKGSTSLNVGPVTTSDANDLLLLGCSTNAGNGFKVPSGFMQLQEINHALLMVGPASSAGSYSTTCSGGGALYTGNLAAFQ